MRIYNPRKLSLLIVFLLCATGALIWIAHSLVGDRLEGLAREWMAAGGLAVFFLVITIINILVVPMSADILIAISPSIIDAEVFWIALASGVSPVLAAWLDLLLGRRYGAELLLKLVGARTYEGTRAIVDRYGVKAIAVTAITPIPFSAVCWACGIGRLSTARALLAVLLTRVPRHLLVLYFADWILSTFG